MRRVLLGILCGLIGLAPAVASAQANGPIIRFANMQVAAAVTGNGSTLDTSGANIAVLQTVITSSATVTFEASQDGTTWYNLFCQLLVTTNPISGAAAVATSTATNMYRCNVAGIALVRARATISSGTVTVKGMATSVGNGGSFLQN